MDKKIGSALISVYYKDGLEELLQTLHQFGVKIYSTGGTRDFIEKQNIPCVPVEDVTAYPAILGGRVKTLHPKIFGGILGKRNDAVHVAEMNEHDIPEIDLVIVDLYPFEETVASTDDEKQIIEKIDVGGPSMLRAAAKNYSDITVIAAKDDYAALSDLLKKQNGATTLNQRRCFAQKAFDVCSRYDIAISSWFGTDLTDLTPGKKTGLRYGENPHQQASFTGDLEKLFLQLHGKELSYNNLVDVDAGLQLLSEFSGGSDAFFAIIKHTNVCGAALRESVNAAWKAALDGDPESAFGGILVSNQPIDEKTANAISEIFFEVLIAPAFDDAALDILKKKKNRILLQLLSFPAQRKMSRNLLNGILSQDADLSSEAEWKEAGGRTTTLPEQASLKFANILCKHLKSNSIALVKKQQLIGKGCGQTSRIDALRQAIEKARQFGADLNGAVLASDAFFPFDDCVRIAHTAGIDAFIQPGGSVRDNDSIDYCKTNNLAMVITGTRHFKH